MKIVVCLKQTLDPEMAPSEFKIDSATKRPVQGNTKLVVDSYAENGLELAVQLRERYGGSITALVVGDKSAEGALRRALALTVDYAVRVWEDSWSDLDAHTVAHILACSVTKIGGADIVLCGRQAADIERGLVGSMLAEELEYACASLVATATVHDNSLQVLREGDTAMIRLECKLPAVLTVTSHETSIPRLPKVKDTMLAMRKPIELLGAADVAVNSDRLAPRVELVDLYIPATGGECELVEGEEPAAQATDLLQRLRERKVI